MRVRVCLNRRMRSRCRRLTGRERGLLTEGVCISTLDHSGPGLLCNLGVADWLMIESWTDFSTGCCCGSWM